MKRKNEKGPRDSTMFVASSGDCTGLMPTPPHTDEELESYDALYPLYPPNSEK